MKFIELTRVPFGKFLLRTDMVVALVGPDQDPFQGHYNGHQYGCCIHAGNETFRVSETVQAVQALLQGAADPLLADPVAPDPRTKAKKRGGS